MTLRRTAVALVVAVTALVPASTVAAATPVQRFDAAVEQILAQPYQPDYVPVGFDSAFPGQVPNTYPVQDYTSGSVPGNPDHPEWPPWFEEVVHYSADGAPLISRLGLQEESAHPGVVVVHGFNTNAKESVIRWAAMLYANGYNVLAVDQRDFRAEFQRGFGYPDWLQTFGWKESEDVLAGGRFLAEQPGVTSVGLMGFSLGAQDTVLALALEGPLPREQRVFSAGIAFSPPADQDTQIWSTREPPDCEPPDCEYPATDALVNRVVPPYTYTDTCVYLADAAAYYATTGQAILARERAYRAQTKVKAPLLNFFAADDPLVQDFQAIMMAGYERGNPLQLTLEVERGLHAYYYDRWWQQRATLLYFKKLLPGAKRDATITTEATVNQTPGGPPFSEQLVDLGSPSRSEADSLRGPYICDKETP